MRRFWWLVPVMVGGIVVGWVVLRVERYEEAKVVLPDEMNPPGDGDHTEQGEVRTLQPPPCVDC